MLMYNVCTAVKNKKKPERVDYYVAGVQDGFYAARRMQHRLKFKLIVAVLKGFVSSTRCME